MNYSYVMGIGKEIYELRNTGFSIKEMDGDYCISFPEEKSNVWEDFIISNLELGFWNEYLTDDNVVFIFHLENGFKRYVVENYDNNEVLSLCEKICNRKFGSIKSMLKNNEFYGDKIK